VAWACVILLSSAQAQDYSDREEVASILAEVGSAGVDVAWARDLLASAKRQQSILDAIARPAEKTKPWYDYRDIFMTDRRIREGVVFWDAHAAVLEEISQRTGVPSAVIVAIIGVETFYGRITGSYRVIDALSTLAFDYPRRSPFFTQELEQFLILAWESGKDPLALKGSYAGAMGYGQFMPSSYRAYARSFEPGGVPDIWDNPADAISSVGHYLNAHGWQAGERVLLDAVANQPPDSLFAAGLKPSQSIETLARAGLSTEAAVNPQTRVTPISLETIEGQRYWLGLQNFYVITRYNHSAMYAMAVWELSEAILAARLAP
jgi:membrane-bound lytic murein transglycosylase B